MSRHSTKEEQTVIFLHIPKSGGITLYDILNREYGRYHIYTFSGGRSRLQQDIDKFRDFPIDQRNSFRLLRGHVPFGIHHLLHKPYSYVTLLRDPVSRVVSHYYYVLNNPNHLLHEKVTSEQMSLDTYVSSGINYELDNGQTRQLAGVTDELPYGKCTDELLIQAQENIEQSFTVVGFTERFDETLLLMKQALGWQKYPVYTRQNVSKNHQGKPVLTEETRQLIMKYNQFDLQLYAFAKQRFNNQLSSLPDNEIETFNKLNRLYLPFGKLSTFSHESLRRIHAMLSK